jgi:HD-like signal output (HDOD) protein
MDKITIIEEIRQNKQLLSLPQVLSEILEEVGREDFTSDSLATIILKDPSLTGSILRLANSAFYQRFNEIKTVNQAISVLGVTTVKCLALSTTVFHPDKIAGESGVEPRDFFNYVLGIAAASEKIAQMIGYESPEEALIAGLLNDIGVMYFLHHYPREYRKIITRDDNRQSLVDAEREALGIDHCEVGSHLAETWKLPDYIVKSITDHHSLTDIAQSETLSNIVRLAVLLAKDNFSGQYYGLEERLDAIHRISGALSLSKSKVDEISFSLMTWSIEMAEYLGLDIGNYEEMLAKANKEIWQSYLTIENLFKERQELSRKLLVEERNRGAIESKNIAIATLSHYLNNAAMAIYGRSQIMRMLSDKGNSEKLIEQFPISLDTIDNAVKKIVAVLEEMKKISPIDEIDFYNVSKAMNIDDRINERMSEMIEDSRWNAQVEVLEQD